MKQKSDIKKPPKKQIVDRYEFFFCILCLTENTLRFIIVIINNNFGET